MIDLPMRSTQHDALNATTLNVGGGGAALNAAFGTGAATPTKLDHQRGYTLDGGDYFTVTGDASFPSGTYSVWMLVDMVVTDGDYLFDATAGTGSGRCSIAGAVITPSTGTVYQDGLAGNTTLLLGRRPIVIVGMTIDASTSLIIGADNTRANNMTGLIHQFGIVSGTLSPTQVRQATNMMARRFNQI